MKKIKLQIKKKNWAYALLSSALLYSSCATTNSQTSQPLSVSGIYPHLAMYNEEGECGTGAVVPWGGKLWAITYGPHLPHGSSDKLYEIGKDLSQTIREESIGGTPANRMIHDESKQLFIGPYAIDENGKVRTIPYKDMPGRITGTARHLAEPAHKLYHGTMEEGFYEVDVNSLDVKWIYSDTNVDPKKRQNIPTADLPGYHGKGLYSGQGVLVYSNNGEYGEKALKEFDTPSGSLSEWDGQEWKVIRRNQFTEVTGPGGIHGNPNPMTDPIWATGWDHKSLLLAVRGNGQWKFLRMPKASHSYDGAHGWNTEWPRIRNVGTDNKPDYLMTMHGMFWSFPQSFSIENMQGIRPRSSYLKVVGDFARWDNQLVFGTDDSAENEFLNKRKAKGTIEGAGQSHSNLWFTSLNMPDELGPNTAEGSVWQVETVEAGTYSDPMLFSGWQNSSCWLTNHDDSNPVEFTFEVDLKGNDQWQEIAKVNVLPGETIFHNFSKKEIGEWVRVKTNKTAEVTTHFVFQSQDERTTKSNTIFAGLSTDATFNGGLLYGLGENRRAMGMVAYNYENGIKSKVGYYELDEKMNLVKKTDEETASFIEDRFVIPEKVVEIESSSVLVVDDKGRRWRLPLGAESYDLPTQKASLRICREVVTERDLFSCHGTFYELPAENADGYAKIRPISSHSYKINDYASYRGMLIMTGIDLKDKLAQNNQHVFVSDDQKAAVWAGVIDDLWKLGKPTGHGGPWKDTRVSKGQLSDPYLIGFYDHKSLKLSHDAKTNAEITVEVDPGGEGNWMKYKTIEVKSGETVHYEFPKEFQARWIRFAANIDCSATAWLDYK